LSSPNIAVAIEPSDGMSILFEPVAPKDTAAKASGLMCLELAITNNEKTTIHLNKVMLAFSAPGATPTDSIPVLPNWVPPSGLGINIVAGSTAVWNFLRESFENDSIQLPSPSPATVTLSLFFDGFSSPWTATHTLAPHKNPVTGNAYLYPGQFEDLRAGEFWSASSNTHGTGAQGSQLFAYDMGVVGWNNGALSGLLPGTDGTKNEHYRVWGKKVHAMADGTVLQFLDGVGANFFPGTGNDAGPWQQAPWNVPAKAWADKVGAGNHFYLQHGNEVVLYAHMQAGTLTAQFLKIGATVKAGDVLGLAGNAGSSSAPHLHIHSIKGTQAEIGPLRPLLFREIFVVDTAAVNLPNVSGPWARVNVEGPPLGPVNSLIWPLGRNPEWQGWQDLGGPLTAPPAVASWAANRLDVFSAGSDQKLNHKWWDGSAWHNWQTLGGVFQGGPAAVSWGPNRIDVFVRGTDNHLGHFFWNGSQWNGWEDLGGPIGSAPAVSSWAVNRLDVFAAGANGQLQHKWWDGAKWHDWQTLGGVFKGAPAAVSWGDNRIDVFVRGTDDHLGHLFWNGSQWKGWEDLGGPIGSAPAVSSWGVNRLDVFAAGTDGQLMHKWWDGNKWSEWDGVGGVFQDNPAAVSWGSGRIDVFVRGVDNHLGHLWMG